MIFHPQEIIRRKRDGHTLSTEEIQAFVRAVVERQMTDAQIAAFLMAVFLRKLDEAELGALTQAMRFSGDICSPAAGSRTFRVDKHSTGGVGDKTSLLIAPILAAAGLAQPTAEGVPRICVPMISGSGLGHTGGTLDKLETIPGFDTQLSLERFEEVLRQCGAALIGQTPRLVPADRILYALRDHTATVESPYLITASIMSKKLAESLDALVLDVKTGSGAFMQREEDARLLARLMVDTGEAAGTRTVALLTNHSQPIGRYAGNWLEVKECVDIMQGEQHAMSADLIELGNLLAGWVLHLAGQASTPAEGAAQADEILARGDALKAFVNIVRAQGGDTSVIEGEAGLAAFHKPGTTVSLVSEHAGFLKSIDTMQVGWAVQRLGAGRLNPGETVDAHAGIEVHAKLGDWVEIGQPLVTLFAASEILMKEPLEILRAAYQVGPEAPKLQGQLLAVITK